MGIVASFSVPYSRYLNPDGTLCQPLPEKFAAQHDLSSLYQHMVLTRRFDTKAVALQRTGRLGTYASSLGQEAIAVAAGHLMRPEDVLFPTYREHGTQIMRGVTLMELLLYWGGDERGSNYSGPRQDFPVCIPIATQCTHAAGAATAFRLRREARVAVTMCGDGATSKGDFYEALNLAGVWELPLVFIVTNNQWAISVPRERQTCTETLAQKAIAGGVSGEQVDGNDIMAMLLALEAALERARNEHRPALIEALTYRMADHTTADDASRYRAPENVEEHEKLDPISRLGAYLRANGSWGDAREAELIERVDGEIERAIEAYLETPPQPPESMFEHLYESLPKAYQEQRAAVSGGGKSHG